MRKNMDMILHTIYLVEVTLLVFKNARHVFEKVTAMRCCQGGCSVFCTEHNLIEYLGIAAHGVEPLRGSGYHLFFCPPIQSVVIYI